MKKTLSILCCLALSSMAVAQQRNIVVTVSNSSSIARTDEPVTIQLKDIKNFDIDTHDAIVKLGGKEVPCQLDDMDGDMKVDELFFLADIPAKGKQTYEVTLSASKLQTAAPKQRIYSTLQIGVGSNRQKEMLRFDVPGKEDVYNEVYMHGMTMESELVAYRVYFDHRQNIDIYGKGNRVLEIPQTHFHPTNKQLAEGSGCDVLWIGDAIGCGAFKNYENGEVLNWTDVKIRGQHMVTTGPLRTVMEMYDLGTTKSGKQLNMHQYYTLYAGHRDMKVDIQIDQKIPGATYCTGVQKIGTNATDSVRCGHKSTGILQNDGIAASWGCDYPDMHQKGVWDPQAAGLAVYVPTKYIKEAKEDNLDYLYLLDGERFNRFTYYVSCCADREKQGYHTPEAWFDTLGTWKQTLEEPVSVAVK